MSQSSLPTTLLANLPIAEVVPDVLTGLKKGNVMLHAEPGAGKSTGLPLALLGSAATSKKIIMLEPRRLAALGVANRLASQLGEPLGQRIGLRMRGQTKVSNATLVEVVTEGVLTRMLQTDPTLDGVGLVIFDEFHERSLHADLGLALCLEIQQALREDLKLLLMSATLDSEQLNEHLAGATQVHCEGRQFPVETHWLGASRDDIALQVCNASMKALNEHQGDILVFLPGVFEIEKAARLIEARIGAGTSGTSGTSGASEVSVFRLHSRTDASNQKAATAPASNNNRRIILSTSIAETSITIDGVRVVIDAGLERRGRVDPSTGSIRLETVMASQASATQRLGRAGRTASGVCYRLWSESDHMRRSASWQAEIHRSDLSVLVMELGQWGVNDINELPWVEPPPVASVNRAVDLLKSLGLWKNGGLTARGKIVATLPLHPRLGHMLLWAAENGVVEIACQLAVLIEDDKAITQSADIEPLLRRKPVKNQEQRIATLLKLLPSNNSVSDEKPSVSILLAQAYPDWIAQRRSGSDGRYRLACGAGAQIASDDALAHSEWLSVVKLGGAGREARIFQASELNINELEQWSPELFQLHDYLNWDDKQERVIAEEHKKLGSLIIEAKTKTDLSPSDKASALLAGIQQRGISCLPWTEECREWQARVALMQSLPSSLSQQSWPNVDDEALTASLDQWLLVWLQGKSSLKSLSQLDLMSILNSSLDFAQQQALDRLLPRKYKVPSGSHIKLRYANTDQPVLAVKLQEMFGAQANPSVANGHLVLKVELLSPARRPVQITTDLVNFWTNSYPDVKKDLAGRYPKHDWPEDPLVATPTAYAKRRKK